MTDIVERLLSLIDVNAPDTHEAKTLREATDKIKRLQMEAEKDAKQIGHLEYILANIRDDTIPNSLDPDEYAFVALRP